MRRPARSGSGRLVKVERQAPTGSRRDRLAVLLALVTYVCLGLAFLFSNGTQFLMPGPLASAHGAIEDCGSCHTKSGSGKLSWVHGLVAGDPLADSKACLTCHKMPDTAFNAHSASAGVLRQSTERLIKVAAVTPAPPSARAQNIAFPTQEVVAGGLYCATCHQEHKGANFDLKKISNEQCRSCHVVKFDSFDGNHPKFDNYPFKRRTRIIYDHMAHFSNHFPEVAQKDAAKRIPPTCSTCHDSRKDKRVMAVAPFEQTCTTCHLDQVIGKERATGPKGIAFLSLPGLDLDTLKAKNASIGEWPEESEAGLTPFMQVMIGRSDRGRALVKTVSGLNLQDLGNASDDQIKAVTNLVWEIKGLFYALIKGKASDVLGNLNVGGGAKLSANLVVDLTASVPRDVLIGAQQQWLPNLGTEMANRPADTSDKDQSGWNTVITESKLAATVSPEELFGVEARQPAPRLSPQAEGSEAPSIAQPIRLAQANKPADQTDDLLYPNGGAPQAGAQLEVPAATAATPSAPPEAPAAPKPAAAAAQPAGGNAAPAAPIQQAQNRGGDQTDDLLFPNGGAPQAAGGGEAPSGGGEAPSSSGWAVVGASPGADAPAGAPAGSDTVVVTPQARGAPVVSIQSDVDPESWAEYGGWYQQDYAIFYRPTGHKDKFIYSWLVLTGLQAPKGDTSPAAAVFDSLTGKDAQGSCVKCHSIDDIQGKWRLVNFAPPKVETKQGRFTNFIHEPHFGIMENRGCLTCHNLGKSGPYLKSFAQDNPQSFVSNFGAVKKELCQTCHTASMARQDCLTCHKYHVNGVTTPVMSTKIPSQ